MDVRDPAAAAACLPAHGPAKRPSRNSAPDATSPATQHRPGAATIARHSACPVTIPEPCDTDGPLIPAAFQDVLGYHLRIAQDASFQAIRLRAGWGGIKPGWFTLLTLVHETPGMTPSQLSRVCGRDRSTLTGTLKQLASHGLISRRRNPADQRSYAVRLTAKGTSTLTALRVQAQRHDARLDALAGADRPVLLAALRRIATGLKQEAEQTP